MKAIIHRECTSLPEVQLRMFPVSPVYYTPKLGFFTDFDPKTSTC